MSGSGNWTEAGRVPLSGDGTERNPFLALPASTKYSKAHFGRVRIDPSIRAIQEQGLARNNNLYNALGSQAESLLGNQNAFITARVNPLEREYTQRQGEVQRNIGLRGLSGSSFGEQTLSSLANEKQTALGDARALATQESLDSLAQVRAQQAQVAGYDATAARDRFQQELQALGLGQQQVTTLINAFESYQQREVTAGPYQTQHSGAVTGGMGGGGSMPSAGG
jgi:hypothetical protein